MNRLLELMLNLQERALETIARWRRLYEQVVAENLREAKTIDQLINSRQLLTNGYRAIHSYLVETRDRGHASPVGRHVREMIELMADEELSLQPTPESVALRQGLEEQIALNNMPPEDKAKIVRVS